MANITLAQLTEATTEGTGVFDVLMKATKAHLEQEYKQQRIKGGDYATVYLGGLTQVMQASLQFLLAEQKAGLEADLITQQIALLTQQTLNAVTEGANLVKQGCVLDAQFDLLSEQRLKTVAEGALLAQKLLTERAQTIAAGVDADSVVGKQKTLYQAQADGFKSDAIQKSTKMIVDTWNVRRTTDEGTVADGTNKLNDTMVGRFVEKLASDVGA